MPAEVAGQLEARHAARGARAGTIMTPASALSTANGNGERLGPVDGDSHIREQPGDLAVLPDDGLASWRPVSVGRIVEVWNSFLADPRILSYALSLLQS
jgi:hypothetical protein